MFAMHAMLGELAAQLKLPRPDAYVEASEARQAVGSGQERCSDHEFRRGHPRARPVGGWLVHGGREGQGVRRRDHEMSTSMKKVVPNELLAPVDASDENVGRTSFR